MNLMPWRNADADTKHDVIVMLAIHSLLLTVNFVLFAFVLIPYPDQLDGEAGPWTSRLVHGISNDIRYRFLPHYLPISLAGIWMDTVAYISLHKRFGKRAAFIWKNAISLLLLLPTALFFKGSFDYMELLEDKLKGVP